MNDTEIKEIFYDFKRMIRLKDPSEIFSIHYAVYTIFLRVQEMPMQKKK